MRCATALTRRGWTASPEVLAEAERLGVAAMENLIAGCLEWEMPGCEQAGPLDVTVRGDQRVRFEFYQQGDEFLIADIQMLQE